MKRGRPFGSVIRQNLGELLNVVGKAYGYELHKWYIQLFAQCTREVIYYHLRIGVKLGEFEVKEVKQEKGDFSWGRSVEKTYYALGPKANPKNSAVVKAWAEQRKKPQS